MIPYDGLFGWPVREVPKGAAYAYPEDLARLVRERWVITGVASGAMRRVSEAANSASDVAYGIANGPVSVAALEKLEELLATCYQSSFLREEERPVTFRAILAKPETFPEAGGPPDGLQRLEFTETRPLSPTELRRLSVAAEFHQALVGVGVDESVTDKGFGLHIWGLIHQGSRWLEHVQGGRGGSVPLPNAPIVHVGGPGHLEVYKGFELVGKLEGGRLSSARADLFNSQWLPAGFYVLRDKVAELHEADRNRAREFCGERWATLEADLERQIGERMMKRVISVVRDAHHGGTILLIPSRITAQLSDDNSYMDIKYPFKEGKSRYRYRDLIVGMLNRLAQIYGTTGDEPSGGYSASETVGWREFEFSTDRQIAVLDEALFEQAHLISGLAASDGAVVLDEQNELLGFGAEISGRLPVVDTVARALDLEGESTAQESPEEVGTRHRSAYRLCGALPGVLAVVISQDGGVRFVCQKQGQVTYWDQD